MDPFEILIDKKVVLEERIRILSEELGDLRTCPLIDKDGFPKKDIDHYSIMIARSDLSKAREDYKEIMEEIERQLPQAISSGKKYATKPFAVVNNVSANSLAEGAGLKVGDKILQLDSVTRFEDLSTFSLGKILCIKVLREADIVKLETSTDGFSSLGAFLSDPKLK